MGEPIDLCLVHFTTLTLTHLDAAWYSVSRQSFRDVARVVVLDNNSGSDRAAVAAILTRYPIPVPIVVEYQTHGDPAKTHSWSVNRMLRDLATAPRVLFTRSDYILAFDALARLRAYDEAHPTERLFVSGWCWQMAYDRDAQNIDATVDIEPYDWRRRGMSALLQHPYAFRFHETDLDAGVWFTQRQAVLNVGGLNEGMSSWGFQQSEFQRRLTRSGVRCHAIPDYLFAHQHHYADRDFRRARTEWVTHSGQ